MILMKKVLRILFLSFLLSGSTYAEKLGVDKSVNDYVNDGYRVISSVTSKNYTMTYDLRSDGKNYPLVVICIYSMEQLVTVCFKP